jgi:hypothetical protein
MKAGVQPTLSITLLFAFTAIHATNAVDFLSINSKELRLTKFRQLFNFVLLINCLYTCSTNGNVLFTVGISTYLPLKIKKISALKK